MGDGIDTVAVPSVGEGGMTAQRSGHFGRCDCFTLIDVEGGSVREVRVVENPPHEEGGCLRPVELLSSHGADALIVAGIGARPLAGFDAVGISVYHDAERPVVGDVVAAFTAGELSVIDPSSVCGGH
jgi:predicted Fe-Mo cluster-binding NifX family protein